MALIRNEHDLSMLDDWRQPKVCCFYCGQDLRYPFVEWRGHETGLETFRVIGVHLHCAEELASHFRRDVTRYDLGQILESELNRLKQPVR